MYKCLYNYRVEQAATKLYSPAWWQGWTKLQAHHTWRCSSRSHFTVRLSEKMVEDMTIVNCVEYYPVSSCDTLPLHYTTLTENDRMSHWHFRYHFRTHLWVIFTRYTDLTYYGRQWSVSQHISAAKQLGNIRNICRVKTIPINTFNLIRQHH
jgi:hypothetical protein